MQKSSFVRKRVKSMTLGERLYQLRSNAGVSVEELSRNINVKPVYIIALENGEYDKLPIKVYSKGFIRSYTRFFGVPEKAYTDLFDKEYSVYQNINHKEDEVEVNKTPQIPRFVFTPKVLAGMGVLLGLSLVGLYLYISIDNFTSSPWLVVDEPKQNSVVKTEIVTVQGSTKSDSKVFINNQQVFVDTEGRFSDTVAVLPGVNVINVKSINKFDKESNEEIIVEADYETKKIEEVKDVTVHIIIKTQNEPEWINVIADNIDVYNDTLQPDEELTFDVVDKIVITTSSGSNTLISEDEGDNFEQMSDKDEVVKERVFENSEQNEEDTEIQESESSGE